MKQGEHNVANKIAAPRWSAKFNGIGNHAAAAAKDGINLTVMWRRVVSHELRQFRRGQLNPHSPSHPGPSEPKHLASKVVWSQ